MIFPSFAMGFLFPKFEIPRPSNFPIGSPRSGVPFIMKAGKGLGAPARGATRSGFEPGVPGCG